MANQLYKEHYSTAKMSSALKIENGMKSMSFSWTKGKNLHSISCQCNNEATEIEVGGLEEFIYEHYFGYTKASEKETWEYRVNHPRWQTNIVMDYQIVCDFGEQYGANFEFLNAETYSIYNALGSAVSIDWGIEKITQL